MHSAWGKFLAKACSDAIADITSMIILTKSRITVISDKKMRLLFVAHAFKHLLIFTPRFAHLLFDAFVLPLSGFAPPVL